LLCLLWLLAAFGCVLDCGDTTTNTLIVVKNGYDQQQTHLVCFLSVSEGTSCVC
jgi:hypothetical protein